MVLFIGLPFLKINGKPALLLDVVSREFSLFGHTYLATDGVLLMLLMLTIFAAVFWTTALVGRAWCGWACPQTVYMEFLFRPIERLFEGKREEQLRLDKSGLSWRRVAKNIVFLVLSFVLANVFLSYFVGAHALRTWVFEAPSEHMSGFLVVTVTSGLMFFDFAYFREQMCTVICPYARLQSVLLDRRSLLIGYDGSAWRAAQQGQAQAGSRRLHRLPSMCRQLSNRHRHSRRAAARMHRLRTVRRRVRFDHGARRQAERAHSLCSARCARNRSEVARDPYSCRRLLGTVARAARDADQLAAGKAWGGRHHFARHRCPVQRERRLCHQPDSNQDPQSLRS